MGYSRYFFFLFEINFSYTNWTEVMMFCIEMGGNIPNINDRDKIQYFINGSESRTVYVSTNKVSHQILSE